MSTREYEAVKDNTKSVAYQKYYIQNLVSESNFDFANDLESFELDGF